MKSIVFTICVLLIISCSTPTKQKTNAQDKEKIIEKYLKNGAWKYHYLNKEWTYWVDKGIEQDSTIAYLWQQKALPLWKQKKYQLAIKCYNKAAELDPKKWLSRMAFLKCIFAKDYQGALKDLKTYKEKFGSTFEQDHSLEFYMGLCYLQLNQFEKALTILHENITVQEKEYSPDWIHYLDRYYLAIAYYEKNNYQEAIKVLDIVLKEYPEFSDALYYKSICLNYLDQKENAIELMALGKANFEKGNTFNEDSNLYENYPYQVTWQWNHTNHILKK